MIDLRATSPAPVVTWKESPYGGNRGVYEWSTMRGGITVTIDHLREPTWATGSAAGTGLGAEFLAAMDSLGIKRTGEP